MSAPLVQLPSAAIPVRQASLPRSLTIGAYVAEAKARGYRVVQYRQHAYLVRIQ